MLIKDSVVFVTGTNRGLGAELVSALKQRGAAKIYAANRKGHEIPGTITVPLDITDAQQVSLAAELAKDTTILINNAGLNFNAPLLNAPDDFAHREMEVNYFGTLSMIRAFSPILATNGGGVIVNLASIAGRVSMPIIGSLCASKAALISMTHSVRAQLAKQNTRVILVEPGPIDTDMARGLPVDKSNPAVIANAILDAIEGNVDDLYPDPTAQHVASHFTGLKALQESFAVYVP